ncbi:MAG: type II toxin-antitoxin system PemK/MazF family toxin [Spirochaetaceae bacterium]|nr:MAG: type II toxin-antitoxin system PemK/MazF family toxin [Spirochaetaceae bacterium]
MARDVKRGDVWLYTFKKPDKRRPVLVVSRNEVIGLLRTVTVAPITSTIHGAPSEVILGIDHGLKNTSAANMDHLLTVSQSHLHTYVGHLDETKLREVCHAMAVALGCR